MQQDKRGKKLKPFHFFLSPVETQERQNESVLGFESREIIKQRTLKFAFRGFKRLLYHR